MDTKVLVNLLRVNFLVIYYQYLFDLYTHFIDLSSCKNVLSEMASR